MVSMGWFNADVSGFMNGVSTIGVGNKNASSFDNESDASNFFNGLAGINYRLSDKFAVNLSFYPGGGGATDWDRPRTGATGGADDGSDYQIRWRMFNLQPSISGRLRRTSPMASVWSLPAPT
jgi:hypothetical protein